MSNGYFYEYWIYLADIDDYELPLISVIGNHEMYAPRGLENYLKHFGDDDFYFDYPPCRFIALNNADPSMESYGLLDDQLGLLEDWLEPAFPPVKFTFLHVPPNFDNYEEYADLVETVYPIPLAFFGHRHIYSTYERNGLRYVITGGGPGGSTCGSW